MNFFKSSGLNLPLVSMQLAELKRCHQGIDAEKHLSLQLRQPPGSFQQLPRSNINPRVRESLAGDSQFFSLLDYSTYAQTQIDRDAVQCAKSRGTRLSLGNGGLFHSPPSSPDRRAAFAASAQLFSPIDRSQMSGNWVVPPLVVDQSLAAESLLIFPGTESSEEIGQNRSPYNSLGGAS